MTPHPATADGLALRARLMAPHPMERAVALHELERELKLARRGPRCAIASQVEKFAARGIPFYSPQDPHFCEWVDKAVAYWEQLRRSNAKHGQETIAA